ncbi:MAG: SxtJ family membrane protein [Bacteroidota bacterium]
MAPTRSDREKREVYSTVLVLGLALLLAFAYWDEIALFYGAIGLLALTLVWYLPVYYLHRAWMYLARGLAWINTRILLGIIFFLILLPLARLRSWFQKTEQMPLHPSDADTYYRERPAKPPDFTKPW